MIKTKNLKIQNLNITKIKKSMQWQFMLISNAGNAKSHILEEEKAVLKQ